MCFGNSKETIHTNGFSKAAFGTSNGPMFNSHSAPLLAFAAVFEIKAVVVLAAIWQTCGLIPSWTHKLNLMTMVMTMGLVLDEPADSQQGEDLAGCAPKKPTLLLHSFLTLLLDTPAGHS